MTKIKDLGFGVIEIFDKDTQYAPAQSIKVGNTTYIREDLINKQIADLQHRLKVAEIATKLVCKEELRAIGIYDDDLDYKKEMSILEQQYKEQAEKEIKGE